MKHYRKINRNRIADVYAFIYAVLFTVGEQVFKVLDFFGKKLVDLIDHSEFFAGVVWTYTVMTAWELLTR